MDVRGTSAVWGGREGGRVFFGTWSQAFLTPYVLR